MHRTSHATPTTVFTAAFLVSSQLLCCFKHNAVLSNLHVSVACLLLIVFIHVKLLGILHMYGMYLTWIVECEFSVGIPLWCIHAPIKGLRQLYGIYIYVCVYICDIFNLDTTWEMPPIPAVTPTTVVKSTTTHSPSPPVTTESQFSKWTCMLTRELNVINSPALSTEGGRRPIAVSGHSKNSTQHFLCNELSKGSLTLFFLSRNQRPSRKSWATNNTKCANLISWSSKDSVSYSLYPCSTPIHFYSVHIHLHCRLLSSYSYVCMQVNGLTFTDGPSDQQLLNQGEQSYIDHFWVNCSSLHTFLYYCAIGLTANFWVKLMQIYFPFSFITHTTKLMIFDSELCFFMWVETFQGPGKRQIEVSVTS